MALTDSPTCALVKLVRSLVLCDAAAACSELGDEAVRIVFLGISQFAALPFLPSLPSFPSIPSLLSLPVSSLVLLLS